MVLIESGRLDWPTFQRSLVDEIGSWEETQTHGSVAAPYRYYDRWLAALERVAAEKELVSDSLRRSRAHELANRPHGHDH